MAIIILPVCFIAIFFIAGIYSGQQVKKTELLLISIITFSVLLTGITELLSVFKAISFSWVFTAWSMVTLTALMILYRKKTLLNSFISLQKQKIIYTYRRLSVLQKVAFYTIAGMLLLVFVQGIIYPPNNWDSMTYHMGRIVSWVGNRSVAYYPTSIFRQLYQPPFAEYVIMHVNLLHRSDYLSNSVQFAYFIGTLIALAGITNLLGLNRYYQMMAVVLGATLPEALLQASSTQNDVVVSFFILAACYFGIKAVRRNKLGYYCFFGLSAGLALLTKGTAYVYMAPLILLIGIASLRVVIKTRQYKAIGYLVMSGVLCLLVNSINYTRNFNFNSTILGVDAAESKMYANEHMSPGLLFSSIVKNASLHLSISHTGVAADVVDTAVHKIHKLAGINLNEPGVNYYGMPYKAQVLPTSEDSGPNPIHFILAIIAAVLFTGFLIKKHIPGAVLFIAAAVLLQGLFFCGYLKWQPWHSRLHVPMFMLVIPLVCYAMGIKSWYRKMMYAIIPVLLLYALGVICFNYTRPLKTRALLTTGISISSPRYEKYFAARPNLYPEYKAVTDDLKSQKNSTVALETGTDDWVYPLFTDCFAVPRRIIYTGVNNISKKYEADTVVTDCLISTKPIAKQAEHKGKALYHKNTPHKFIYLYR